MLVWRNSLTDEIDQGRVIRSLALALSLIMAAALAWAWDERIAVTLAGLGGLACVWWSANFYWWWRESAVELARKRAEASINSVQLQLKLDLVREQASLAASVASLNREQAQLAREWSAWPELVVMQNRAGDGIAHAVLELAGTRIPWNFCAEWMTIYRDRDGDLPPVRYWSQGASRDYAAAIQAALEARGMLLPAAGNQPARWLPGIGDAAREQALIGLGVSWAAWFWEQMTETEGNNDDD